MKSKHYSDTKLPEYGINQWLNICMTKTHRKYFFPPILSLLAKLPVVWFLSCCSSVTLFLEHRLQAHGLCYQRSPLISSQHHTSSVIWPINKLQRGVGVVRALPAAHCQPQDGTTCFSCWGHCSDSSSTLHLHNK